MHVNFIVGVFVCYSVQNHAGKTQRQLLHYYVIGL